MSDLKKKKKLYTNATKMKKRLNGINVMRALANMLHVYICTHLFTYS